MRFLKRPSSIAILLLFALMIYYFFPEQKLGATVEIDKIIVLKSERKLLVMSGDELLKSYVVSLGRNPIGAKQFEGDDKTPEGVYKIDSKNPHSAYFLNLGVSYPSKRDLDFAKKHCRSAGGLIKIHGLKNGLGFIGKFHRWFDWTHGCIAVTNKDMKELYENVKIGTPIEIKP